MENKNKEQHNFVIEEIRERDRLESIKHEWNALIHESYQPNFCSTYEWLTTWWDAQLRRDKRLLVLVIKDEHRIIGIIPFTIFRERFFFLPTIKIEFISMAPYADSPSNVSVALDFLLGERSEEIIKTVLKYLINHNETWHFIRLNPIPGNSPTIPILCKVADELKLPYRCKEVYANISIPINGSWEKYYSQLSKNFRKSLCNNSQTLSEVANLNYKMLTTETEIKEYYPIIMDVERRSWKWNVGISINSTSFNDFYNRFARIASNRGWLQLWLLQVNHKYIAYDYNIVFNNFILNLKASYDAEYKDYSPGNLLLAREIEHAFRSKMKSFNMLWGMTIQKRRWIPTNEPHYEIFVFKKTCYAQVLYFLFFTLSLNNGRRKLLDYRNRLLRKLKIRWKNSELTRIDQLK
jgi:CelD/BcsL family acetyltransferase involved in cellulose biosynthesis